MPADVLERAAARRSGLAPGARIALAVALLAVIAEPVAAAPRLEARSAFRILRWSDAGCAIVEVENDATPREILLRSVRVPAPGRPLVRGECHVRLDLAPHARKRVFLPIRTEARPDTDVEIVDAASGTVLAITRVAIQWADVDAVMVASLAPAPRTLQQSAVQLGTLRVGEVPLDDLPPQSVAWPRLDAFAFEIPPGATLPDGVAAALRSHVLDGGLVVAGTSPEDPEAWQRAGLADLLPARPVRGAPEQAALTEAVPGAIGLPVEGALAISRGMGRLVLVPRPLDAVATDSWPALLSLPGDAPADWQQKRQARARRWGSLEVPLPDHVAEALVPRPPWWPAGILLGLFFIAAVPVDGWLTRRSLRTGRRSRFGALRYPALGAAAALAGLAIAQHSAGGDSRSIRVDVIDVGPDGNATARTGLLLARGRAGLLRVASDDALILGAWSSYGWDEQAQLPSKLRVASDPSLRPSEMEMTTTAWEPLSARASWTPPAEATAFLRRGLSPTEIAASARAEVAWIAATGERAEAWVGRLPIVGELVPGVDPAEFALSRIAHEAVGDARFAGTAAADSLAWDGAGAPDLMLFREGRTGPEIRIDGRPDDGLQFTVFRIRLARAAAATPLQEHAP